MHDDTRFADFGFGGVRVPTGAHICQIYGSTDERDECLLEFLLSGLQAGECTACFSENLPEGTLRERLEKRGESLSSAKERGALTLMGTSDVYFEGGLFDPDRMLGRLTQFHQASVTQGYPAARVIGEMSSEIAQIPGGSRLLEYEARVSLLLRERPVTAMCQYDVHAFDGATIMDVLTVHPMMIVRGNVVLNPFFVPPEEILR